MVLSAADLIAEALELIEEMPPQAAAAAMAEGAILIDTRCVADRESEGIVPGSVLHHRTVLEWRVDPEAESRDPKVADRSMRHIIMCNDGFSSALAAANLMRMGFENTGHLEGGFRAWKAAGLTVEPA